MNRTTRSTLVIALAAFSALCFAQTAQEAPPAPQGVQVSFKGTYRSKYIPGSNGFRALDKPVYQGNLVLSLGSDYLSLWGSYSPAGGWNSDFGDEVDVTLGHVFVLNKVGTETLDLSVSQYDLMKVGEASGDLYALTGVYSTVVGRFNPYLQIEGQLAQDPAVLPGGTLWKGGVRWTEQAGTIPLELEFNLLGHDGLYGTRPETLSAAQFDIGHTFLVGKSRVRPSILFQKNLGRPTTKGGLVRDEVVFSISIAF